MPHPALGHATVCLRRAESLAGLAGGVSGPADAPPAALAPDWINDWIDRAKRVLEQALDEVKRDGDAAKDRARQMAEAIKSGAEKLLPFTNPAFAAGQAAGDAAKARAQAMAEGMKGDVRSEARGWLEKIIDVAKRIILYSAIGFGALILLWLGFSILSGWAVTKTLHEGKGALKEYASYVK